MPVNILQAVAQNVQRIHIKQQVVDAAMQERGGDKPPELATQNSLIDFSAVNKGQIQVCLALAVKLQEVN